MVKKSVAPKKDFPILEQKIYNQPLVYLDNAATTHRPMQVSESMATYTNQMHSNTGRSNHYLATKATEAVENTREQVKQFLGASSCKEIIFTKSATESINMIAYGLGLEWLEEGDEIVVLVSEHHGNLLPWQRLARLKKAKLVYLYLNEQLKVDTQAFSEKINERTKIVAISHVSNVLGYINPIKEIVEKAHEKHCVVVVDGTQAVPHFEVDVVELDADFYVFSSHKVLGPTGVGLLYGKEVYLEKMEPLLLGGSMVEEVSEREVTYQALPHRLEAGTLNIEGIVGLGEALSYLKQLQYKRIIQHDKELTAYSIEELKKLPFINLIGEEIEDKIGVIAFNVEGVHAHDVGSILDAQGIAIRVGHHCAHPLMHYLNIPGCCRVSFSVYNTKDDIDALINGLKKVRSVMGLES